MTDILKVAAYTQAQSEQPYDTLFPLSPRQIVTSVVAALSRLFLHLLQNQAFSRTRTPGIHFAETILEFDDCITAPRCPRGAPPRNSIRSQRQKTNMGNDRYQSVSSFSLEALINEPNSNTTGSS